MTTYQKVSSRGVECEPQQDPDWVGLVTSSESTSKSVHSAWIMTLIMWLPCFQYVMYSELQKVCQEFLIKHPLSDARMQVNGFYCYKGMSVFLLKIFTSFPSVMLMLPLHAGRRTRYVTGCRSRVSVFMWTWLVCGSPQDRRCYRPHNRTWKGWEKPPKIILLCLLSHLSIFVCTRGMLCVILTCLSVHV